MRTFHTGGVAGNDITQGLPRVEELFEARKPKKAAVLTENGGEVRIEEGKRGTLNNVVVFDHETGESKTYAIAANIPLKVKEGDVITRGTALIDGPFNPHDVLRTRDVEAVRAYIIQEVQRVYHQHGVDINDRHIEIIVRQMMRSVKVEKPGDTDLLPGSMIDIFEFEDANAAVAKRAAETGEELEFAECSPMLLGITKASLATDSFLSAASFQETTRVLTDAAIKGKVDPLLGLKENVIIGKLIPAGSGMDIYNAAGFSEVADSPEPIEVAD
jgi:DNA-directed RNA polymerase subunit beta'